MKMLALAILLVSFPWLSHADDREYNRHNRHHHENKHNHSYFWHKIADRRHQLHRKIDEAKHDGLLTRRELKQLKRERKHLAKQIKHFKRHNHLNYANKRSIRKHLKHYSAKIHHLTHNNQTVHRGRGNHNHKQYTQNYNNIREHNSYNRPFSWASNEFSTGIYFRF